MLKDKYNKIIFVQICIIAALVLLFLGMQIIPNVIMSHQERAKYGKSKVYDLSDSEIINLGRGEIYPNGFVPNELENCGILTKSVRNLEDALAEGSNLEPCGEVEFGFCVRPKDSANNTFIFNSKYYDAEKGLMYTDDTKLICSILNAVNKPSRSRYPESVVVESNVQELKDSYVYSMYYIAITYNSTGYAYEPYSYALHRLSYEINKETRKVTKDDDITIKNVRLT